MRYFPLVFEKGLTGARRYRSGWFGKVILQVEVRLERLRYPGDKGPGTIVGTEWRDARPGEVGLLSNLYTPPTFLRIQEGRVVEVDQQRKQDEID